jgi:photosystem II PsbU protein
VKGLVRLLSVLTLIVGCAMFVVTPQTVHAATFKGITFQSVPVLAVEETQARQNRADERLAEVYGERIDLNNTNVRAFQRYPGFYPTLARKLIANAPYKNVEDVLDLDGLSSRQKDLLQSNLDKFTVTNREAVFNEGDDRINNGIYR